MPRETNAAKRERAVEVCERLNRRYGPVECFLDHENPFRLLIAVLLSAQTTDAQVNKVTPRLFAQWPTPEAMAGRAWPMWPVPLSHSAFIRARPSTPWKPRR